MVGKIYRRSKYGMLLLLISLGCTDTDESLLQETTGQLTITEVSLGNFTFNQLEGSVSTDFTLTNDKKWILNGAIHVSDGSTLTIEPGTTVYAAFNESTSYLSIQQGGKLMAEGTRDKPIFFTSVREITSIPQPGDWGGLIINGRAPINLSGGTGEGEGGTGTYGGNNPNDNSGILKYVIVSYAGKQLGDENELNGISLNAVGNGTTVEYVESIYGNDDGFEIFGGTVNIKYALSLGNADDSFDWTFGWSGYGQFWVAQQDSFGGDRAIEADNNENDFNAAPFSQPIVSNVTLVGAEDGDGQNTGIKLRNGTKGMIHNAIVSNFARHGVDVDESSELFIVTQELVVNYSRVFDNNQANTDGEAYNNSAFFENDDSNQLDDEPILDGFIGIEPNVGLDPSDINDWFTSVNYIGAVDPQNDWTSGWILTLR